MALEPTLGRRARQFMWLTPLSGNIVSRQSQDLYDAARIVDQMEHIHFFQRSMVLRDIEDPAEMDFNTCYAAIAGTRKHVGTSFVDPAHVHQTVDMLEMVAGGEEAWRARPFVSCSCCFVVPPMRFAEDACRVLEACVERGMPILLLAAGQAGATSPASLAGSGGTGSCGSARRPCLRESSKTRSSCNFWDLAFCFGSSNGCNEWRKWRAGSANGGLWPDGSFL